MQFRDLKKQYQVLKNDIDAGIAEVLASAQFISGPQVKALEAQLAEYVGVKHCVTCANGTDAITLAMMAWGVKEGDAVFVPDFTFFSSGECPAFEGATPVYVDVDERTFNLDPVKLEEAIIKVKEEGRYTPKAVVAVDLFGLPADYTRIRPVCEKYGLLLMEDAAQGFGGSINGKMACSFGDISTTSFFPAKPLGCYGDGGAVFTDNLQAAILMPKLKAFADYELDDVNKAADMYMEALKDAGLTLPLVPEGFRSSWAQFTTQLPADIVRADLQAALKAKGIPTMVYYPKPMHLQGAFEGTYSAEADCPVTERLCATVLSLPMHPYLTQEDVNEVVSAIKECLA